MYAYISKLNSVLSEKENTKVIFFYYEHIVLLRTPLIVVSMRIYVCLDDFVATFIVTMACAAVKFAVSYVMVMRTK